MPVEKDASEARKLLLEQAETERIRKGETEDEEKVEVDPLSQLVLFEYYRFIAVPYFSVQNAEPSPTLKTLCATCSNNMDAIFPSVSGLPLSNAAYVNTVYGCKR
ncbi:hypothetical protein Unana1_02895 [Umbelopsis nana]